MSHVPRRLSRERGPVAPPPPPPLERRLPQQQPIAPSSLSTLEHAAMTMRETAARLTAEAETIEKYIRARQESERALERQRAGPKIPIGSTVYRIFDAGYPPRWLFVVLAYNPISDAYTVRNTRTQEVDEQKGYTLAIYFPYRGKQ